MRIVIVDTDVSINKLHFETVRKSLEQDFSIAFMTRQDFAELLVEVDTPAHCFITLDRSASLAVKSPSFLPKSLSVPRAIASGLAR